MAGQRAKVEASRQTATEGIGRLEEQRSRLERGRLVFTIDTELDEIMTAFRVTFMHLSALLVRDYLGATPMSLDTLIRGVLTLPGERVLTPGARPPGCRPSASGATSETASWCRWSRRPARC